MAAWQQAWRHRIVALLGGWLLLAAGEAASAPAPDLAAALRSGRAFVAVLVDPADRRLAAGEAYADWHAYYRSFLEKGRGDLPVHTLTPARARAQLAALRRVRGPATLFVNARGQALIHDGLVLEPQVYVIGRAFAEGGGDAPPQAADYGLRRLALKG